MLKKLASLFVVCGIAASTLGGCYVRETRRGSGYHHHDGYAHRDHGRHGGVGTTIVVRP